MVHSLGRIPVREPVQGLRARTVATTSAGIDVPDRSEKSSTIKYGNSRDRCSARSKALTGTNRCPVTAFTSS
jgi:hypothetical protein